MIEVREGRYHLSGPLTLNNAMQLRAEGLGLFASSREQRIDIDCAEVTEVDSAALSLLFEWARVLSKQGKSLRYSNLPQNMRSLASVYEVQDLIPTI